MGERNIKELYNKYTEIVTADIDKYLKQLDDSKAKLERLSPLIETACKHIKGYDKLLDAKSGRVFINYELDGLQKTYFLNYYQLKSNIEESERMLKVLTKINVESRIYSIILGQLGVGIRKACIEDNFEFKMPYGLGSFKVVRRKRRRPKIDWKETAIEKQRLLDAGVPIFDKVNNPDGKKFFVYFSDPYDYYFVWTKHTAQFKHKRAFILQFNSGPTSPSAQLYQYIRDNPLRKVMYTEFTTKKRLYAERMGKFQTSDQ